MIFLTYTIYEQTRMECFIGGQGAAKPFPAILDFDRLVAEVFHSSSRFLNA